jgi:hypothetical protein
MELKRVIRYNALLIQWLKDNIHLRAGTQQWVDTDKLYAEFLASPVGWKCRPSQFRRTIRRMGYDICGSVVNV